MIGKYYFCIVRDKVKAIDSLKLKQTFISITKISPECKKSVFDYKPFKKYIKMKHLKILLTKFMNLLKHSLISIFEIVN